MKYGFGVDLGGTTVKIAYLDETGNMLDKWEIPTVTANGGVQILPDIAASVLGYIKEKAIPADALLGIGIGVPGPVDTNGIVNKCINLGWGRFSVSDELSKLTGLPVRAGNDANVAALGEYWKGGGAGYNSMVFVTLGTGVGGGIVINGNLLFGAHGSGAEIGHMVLNRNETVACGCGKHGCVEQYCSATGIIRLAKNKLAETDEPSVLRSYEKFMAKEIFDGAKAGDKVASQVVADYFEYMGEFLGSLCSVIDPDVVVLGGGVSKAGQVLLDGIQAPYLKYAFHACNSTKFALASLGNDAGAYGAFKLAVDAFGGK